VHRTDNLHVREFAPLVSPRDLRRRLPITDAIADTVYQAREAAKRILRREDRRLLLIVGPCSIHDRDAAMEYAGRLVEAHRRLRDRLLIVMRVYLEKPRTTVGWRGLVNDPHLDGTFDMGEGLARARELLLYINRLGLPTATEMLDPISPQYMSDLIALAAIGARTTESQTHRAMASGLSMPVAFKNNTDGNLQAAVNGLVSMRSRHSFLGIDPDGRSCVVQTSGNPDGLVILRGSRHGPNYNSATVAETERLMEQAGLTPAIMVDCSHANSGSDHTKQETVWDAVLAQHREHPSLVGMMIESNLIEGKQPIPADLSQLKYGISITDACLGWETTERMLQAAHQAVGG
jgi:3-deoxy-7-phosphoheptulonate synthase